MLCLCLLGSGGVHANPVYPDKVSISNGAQLYELYCGECHGSDTANNYGQMYAPSAANSAYTGIYNLAQNAKSTSPLAQSDEDELSEQSDSDDDSESDPRAETMAEFAAVINEAHGIKSGLNVTAGTDAAAAGVAHGFESMPGATNLADPTTYFYGTSEQEIFNSIANGTGTIMVGWREELGSDEAIWDVVNYLRSFWSEEWRN